MKESEDEAVKFAVEDSVTHMKLNFTSKEFIRLLPALSVRSAQQLIFL
jgi:hypothetical protein